MRVEVSILFIFPLIFDLSRDRESVIFAFSCNFEKWEFHPGSFCFLIFLKKREKFILVFFLGTSDNSVKKLAVPYKYFHYFRRGNSVKQSDMLIVGLIVPPWTLGATSICFYSSLPKKKKKKKKRCMPGSHFLLVSLVFSW